MMIERAVSEGLVSENVPLGPMTTYKAGGNARWFAEVGSQSQLESLVGSGLPKDLDVLVVGRGSNMVVADGGYDGLAIKLADEFTAVTIEQGRVTAGSATPLPRLARQVVDSGQTGLEFFVGVPGSVGGAVRQNAGCFGAETSDVLIEGLFMDLRTGRVSTRVPADLDLGYRTSNVAPSDLVMAATFTIQKGDVEAARTRMKEITRWRKEYQPGGTLNAGSVFKNPEGGAAGEIIDRLGLKGTAVGGVSVSTKHANFFVATQDATASQVAELVDVVKAAVLEATGTKLETEIQFVGFEDEH